MTLIFSKLEGTVSEMPDYNKHTDQELASLLRGGDQGTFAFIYTKFKASLYLHALRTIKDADQATDIVQEVFTNLWEKRSEFALTSSIENYLYGAVRNRVFNAIAHQNITDRYAKSIQTFFEKGEFFTDNLIREKELKQIIEKEIEALPKKMREVFLLSRNTDLSHKEIGKELGISENATVEQLQKRMELPELREEKSESEDACNHGELRRLDRSDAREPEPAFGAAVLFAQAGVSENNQGDAREVHRKRGPLRPVV
ncbi:MAG: RNA polymerase sigma-70 factor, partial [Chryseobacterium sp.]